MNLLVRPAAAADIDEAFVWYDAQRTGLGDEFLEAVRNAFVTVHESPRLHAVIHRDVRRSKLRRFPYCLFSRLFSRILGDHVDVVGCFHASRSPLRWQSRR